MRTWREETYEQGASITTQAVSGCRVILSCCKFCSRGPFPIQRKTVRRICHVLRYSFFLIFFRRVVIEHSAGVPVLTLRGIKHENSHNCLKNQNLEFSQHFQQELMYSARRAKYTNKAKNSHFFVVATIPIAYYLNKVGSAGEAGSADPESVN